MVKKAYFRQKCTNNLPGSILELFKCASVERLKYIKGLSEKTECLETLHALFESPEPESEYRRREAYTFDQVTNWNPDREVPTENECS